MTFAKSLDPDQARLFVRSDLDPKCLIHVHGILKRNFLKKVTFEKKSYDNKHANLPSMQSEHSKPLKR